MTATDVAKRVAAGISKRVGASTTTQEPSAPVALPADWEYLAYVAARVQGGSWFQITNSRRRTEQRRTG